MRKPLDLSGTPSHRDLLNEAHRLGCRTRDLPGTGEIAVILPDGTRVRLNHRRKDGVIALIAPLRRLQREINAST